MSANEKQVGGSHYKQDAIQTWDFINDNGIGFIAGNVIKYVARYNKKGGLEDLHKATHYLEKLIEVETAKLLTKRETSVTRSVKRKAARRK